MSSRGGVDWANLTANVYQNKMLAQQTAQGEVMMGQMEQQLAMQHMQEMRHQNIVEKRKLIVALDDIANRAVGVSEKFPEYSLMMLEMAMGLIDDAGLRADDFEEIGDMKSAKEMNNSMNSAKHTIEEAMSQDQNSDSRKMKDFLLVEEDEMELLAQYCVINEEWSRKSSDFEELTPLHKRRNGWRKWGIMISCSILSFFVMAIAGAGLAGDCLMYDSDDPDLCTEYENERLYNTFLLVAFLCLILGWTPGFLWGRKYLKQLVPLNQEYEKVLSIQSTYQSLRQKYNPASSSEIFERRANLIKWVEELTPDNEAMLLNV